MDTRVLKSPWPGPGKPNEEALLTAYRKEGVTPYRWGNAPGDVYPPHSHPFHKIIFVLQGSIVFELAGSGEAVALQGGDRLDLPPGVVHSARVGPEGVECLEGHR
jgi:quercetin dioxygenase-like cupin family protein